MQSAHKEDEDTRTEVSKRWVVDAILCGDCMQPLKLNQCGSKLCWSYKILDVDKCSFKKYKTPYPSAN